MILKKYIFIFITSILATSIPCYAKNEKVIHYIYLGKDYPSAPPLSLLEKILTDEGVQGARLSLKVNNQMGRMFDYKFELKEIIVAKDEDPVESVKNHLQQSSKLIIADLNSKDLIKLANFPATKDAIILNINAEDDYLRVSECRNNVFHIIPSLSMRTDALAQYLIWKKWNKWFLVSGKHQIDKDYVKAVRRSAKKFGAKIVEERSYKLETGNKRVDSGHQQIQTQMPMLTRGAKNHDVVFVADLNESFGLYLPYRTAEPRPVVGTYGLVASAWHRSFEQYAGTQLQNAFEEFAGRIMTEKDYLAWLAVKLLGNAIIRTKSLEPASLQPYILADDLNLSAYKGRPLSFRKWNQQLRQPILISSDRALVSVSPQEGFLHPKFYTDTLGFDKPESKCNLSNS